METERALGLQQVDPTLLKAFAPPSKIINDAKDVDFFLTSRAYSDIVTFLLQLNASCFPRKSADEPQVWELGGNTPPATPTTTQLSKLLSALASFIDEAPPDTGPRRFGNIAFRKWYGLAEANIQRIWQETLPALRHGANLGADKELVAYLLGGFGSAQRLDYGTGHELSFLAFLAGLWKLGAIEPTCDETGTQERALVFHVIEPYLNLVRRLIKTYTLEPAGTHGVWGLDDHFFIPYIFGSAQFGPPISDAVKIPQEGHMEGAPNPGDVTDASAVERHRTTSIYFSAIGFIYDVKKGPFWEHSRTLFDISGVKGSWGKINKGMLKMYVAEVLSKFPVVQHFPFGQLFKWERDPKAPLAAGARAFTQSTASHGNILTSSQQPARTSNAPIVDMPAVRAPLASASRVMAQGNPRHPPPTTLPHASKVEQPSSTTSPTAQIPATRAPWAKGP